MAERAVTREYAAKRLRCSMRTIERMLRDGKLAAVRREDGRLSVDPEDFPTCARRSGPARAPPRERSSPRRDQYQHARYRPPALRP